jgi:hypothetical protein
MDTQLISVQSLRRNASLKETARSEVVRLLPSPHCSGESIPAALSATDRKFNQWAAKTPDMISNPSRLARPPVPPHSGAIPPLLRQESALTHPGA